MSRFTDASLLLRGVGTEPTSGRRFDLGGIGTAESSRVFDIEQQPVHAESSRIFDLNGRARSTSSRLFDLEGPLRSVSRRRFDIIASEAPPAGTMVTNPGDTLTTTLNGAVSAGDTSVVLTSTSGLAVGSVISIGGEYRSVAGIAGSTVTFTAALGADHPDGTAVTTSDRTTTSITRGLSAGTTIIPVASVYGIYAGSTVTIGGTDYSVQQVNAAELWLILSSPLAAPASSGDPVQATVAYLPAIDVFTKGGVRLGLLRDFRITAARSHMLGAAGSVQLILPRTSPDMALVDGDRLIAIGNNVGLPLWAGTMNVEQGIDSTVTVLCPDIFDLCTQVTVKYKEELADNTPARVLYEQIVNLMNAERGEVGELEWDFDGSGSKPYYGDINVEGDPLQAFSAIALRSNTEYAWQADIVDDRLTATLVVRDSFSAPAGEDLASGTGGNVVRRPTYVTDWSTRITDIKLTGVATNVRKYMPEWGQWAVHEFEPYAIRSVAPGAYRRRKSLELRVDWTLSKAKQEALATKTEAIVRQMYWTFLYGYHDRYARPYHEGWTYEGPPQEIEPSLYTGRGWRTRQMLVEYNGDPASGVMVSKSEGQILVVLYDRLAAERTVRRLWFSEATGPLYLTKMHIHGWAHRYDVQGGVIVERHVTPYDHSGALVTSHSVRLMWPGEAGTSHPTTTYHTLRRVISLSEDGAVSENQYFDTSFITGPTTGPAFTRPTIGDAPYLYLTLEPAPDYLSYDQSFITKVYPFEDRRIRDWDPRRDGVGTQLNKRTIVDNAPSTKQRWHVVPWNVLGEDTTSLTVGIDATTTTIYVESIFGLPGPNQTPFILTIDDEPVAEKVKVTKVAGTKLTVQRAQEGTTAFDHEPGAVVRYELPEGVDAWDGFVVHDESENKTALTMDGAPLWPEGEAWADELLAKLSVPQTRLAISVINRDDTWSTIAFGSTHAVNISSEGHPGGITGTVRVIGYTIDEREGTMEVLVEWS